MRMCVTDMKLKSFSTSLLICVAFILLTNTTTASSNPTIVYPVDTPVTTYDPEYQYSELTLDVTPKYIMIKEGFELKWTVNIELKVLSSEKLDFIEIHIWLKTTCGDDEPDWDTNLLDDPEITAPSGSTITGPQHKHDGWYLLEVKRTSGTTFEEDDIISIEFDVTSPDTLTFSNEHYELVKSFHKAKGPGINGRGQESTSNHYIEVYFDVGPEFVIPELPIGTIIALILPLITIVSVTRPTRTEKNMHR